eukprot:COSAG06_NODE_11740_length_1471_cov_0.637755_1_plen_68_part_00
MPFLTYIEHRLMRFKEVVEGRWVDRALSENDPLFEFSLHLSRACLGKMIVSISLKKWRKPRVFTCAG